MDLSVCVGTRTIRGTGVGEEVARNAKRLLSLFLKGCLQNGGLVVLFICMINPYDRGVSFEIFSIH